MKMLLIFSEPKDIYKNSIMKPAIRCKVINENHEPYVNEYIRIK